MSTSETSLGSKTKDELVASVIQCAYQNGYGEFPEGDADLSPNTLNARRELLEYIAALQSRLKELEHDASCCRDAERTSATIDMLNEENSRLKAQLAAMRADAERLPGTSWTTGRTRRGTVANCKTSPKLTACSNT